jgi:hypothetical protein
LQWNPFEFLPYFFHFLFREHIIDERSQFVGNRIFSAISLDFRKSGFFSILNGFAMCENPPIENNIPYLCEKSNFFGKKVFLCSSYKRIVSVWELYSQFPGKVNHPLISYC